MNDLRFAFRQLLKNPGFTAVAVLTLALGIGACTAIFTVVDSVLLRPMPYPDSGRLVVLRENKLPTHPEFDVAPGQYLSWREQARSFENLAAEFTGNYNLTGTGDPVRLNARFFTVNYLSTLRVRPALGRDFLPEEDAQGRKRIVLLSHGFWLRQFGGKPEALNQTLQLDGQSFTVVGVLPESFRPESKSDIYLPAAFGADARQNHGGHFMSAIGRLKSGIALAQAQDEMNLIAGRLAESFPDTNKGWGVKLTPLLEYTVGSARRVLFSLLGAVGLLLLIACANVANLLLTRATARAKEIAVRTALGAGRIRIVRQLLTESVLLASFGGLLGVILAHWGVDVLLAFAPEGLPRAPEIALDARVLGLASALALVTGIGFGLVPAFLASHLNFNATLKEGGRGTSDGGRGRRFRGVLIVAEMATALVLLVGAGLLIRSFARLQEVDPGFQPRAAVAAALSLPGKKYGTAPQQAAFAAQVAEQLATMPGVESAGAANVLPFSGDDFNLYFNIAGRPPVDPGIIQGTLYYAVTPDYFRAMGISLVRGRFFDSRDVAGSQRVAIINESMAKRIFPGEDPIGQRINIRNGPESFREIVGIVSDVKHYRLDDENEPRFQSYEPFAQQPYAFMTFVIRATSPMFNSPAAIRTAIATVDKDQPIASVRPLTELVAVSTARQRFAMLLFAVFSGVALLLATIGIYGVMAYSVTQRTGEIGIRMALGAQRADVLRLIFRQGGRLIALGLAAGLVGALLLTRFIASMLFGVSAYDPLTFAAIASLLAGVAAFACWLPARRAARVDPMVALRSE